MSYPVALHLAGRRCVVVGGGLIATRKIRTLLASDADIVVVAPEATADVTALADGGRITLIARAFEPTDLDGAWLVVSATDNPDVARTVAAAAEERRIFCNNSELPSVSSFMSAAVVRQGGVTLSVATDGQSPAFTSWLADQFANELGPEYAQVCELMAELRDELKADGQRTDSVDWRRALDGGMVDLVRAGRIDDARELLRACR